MQIDFLPKHLNEKKIKSEKEVKLDWKYYLSVFRNSWVYKILVYLLLPIVILNFWIMRYDDFSNNCHINIQFSLINWNNLEIKRAIKFIKHKQPADYQKVCRYVDNIELYLPCDFSYGGCFRDSKPGSIGIYSMKRDENNDPSYTAAIIVHETCHAIQRAENRTSGDRETECYNEHERFLREIGVDNKFKKN
jgi:hypothetical protein